jgi:hypothetical protein
MIGFMLLISGLALLGGGAIWCSGRRYEARRRAAATPSPTSDPGDRLPESGTGGKESGLAIFYAYQMAAGKIDRAR